jgi:hypothetical protein
MQSSLHNGVIKTKKHGQKQNRKSSITTLKLFAPVMFIFFLHCTQRRWRGGEKEGHRSPGEKNWYNRKRVREGRIGRRCEKKAT